jgi:uncharacterized protein YndB with AHSA1/START domain
MATTPAPTRPRSVTLQLRRTFHAPRERVFRAWTSAEELKRWHAPPSHTTSLAEIDLRVGGKYRIHMRAPDGAEHRAVGVYREIDPPKKLVFTWTWEGGEMGDTLVTVEFRDRGATTELVLTHELFPNDEARDQHAVGWNAVLDNLAQSL